MSTSLAASANQDARSGASSPSSEIRVASSGSSCDEPLPLRREQLDGALGRAVIGGQVEEALQHGVHEGSPGGGRAGQAGEPVDDTEPVEQRARHEVRRAARRQRGRALRQRLTSARRRGLDGGAHARDCRTYVRLPDGGAPGGPAHDGDDPSVCVAPAHPSILAAGPDSRRPGPQQRDRAGQAGLHRRRGCPRAGSGPCAQVAACAPGAKPARTGQSSGWYPRFGPSHRSASAIDQPFRVAYSSTWS